MITRLFICAAVFFSAVAGLANLPGGGTNGANVTLTDSGSTVTLANGIVSVVITKSTGVISTINYTFNNTGSAQTVNVLSGGYSGGKFYWENSSDLGPAFTYAVVANPTNNGGNYAEVVLTASGSGNVSNIVMEAHYSMLRGNSGFYVTPIWIHRNTDFAFSMGECRDNIYSGSIFNWMTVDATRNKLMPVYSGSAIGVDSAPVECSLWTNGIYAGQYEDKYKYTADYGLLRAWGWSSVGSGGKNVGLWDVAGSFEYMASGPMRRELVCHMGRTILNTPHGGHYGFCTDSTWDDGEVWAKVCGPHFIYCNAITNTITATNTAAQTLYSDALTQADAETAAWPYSWFTNSNYAPAAQRGTVTGKIVISDTNNPNASASNLWVGVEVQPVTNSTITYDFQKWYKPYHFWTKTDSNGNFTIPDVIATTNYTLYAFGPGAAGTFQSQAQKGGSAPNELNIPASPFSVTVPAGATTNLGNVMWTPFRVGPTVFEIGYPDRTAGKFRHGEDWWVGDIGPSASAPSPVWSKFLEYAYDFPNGPNYVVGQSRWTTDWNFIQPVVINNTGAYDPWVNNNGTASTITFNLPAAPASNGSLYIATASSYQGPLIVRVNDHDIAGANGFDPDYDNSGSGSDASIREGIHGLFADNRLSVSSSYFKAGQNTIYINMRKGGYLANHSMYDYLRLELPGYVPPPPASATAFAGNNRNLISWPVQPGATSYNIFRSTTSGSGYVSLTNGVIGPVCGSGWNNAIWLDTTAANGTTYYYVVRSVNPVGSSTNSPEVGVTPNAGFSAAAPAAPTNLVVSAVAHQSVTLNWSAVSNANFYTVYRSTLFNNGGGASNVLGMIVLANNVTNGSYTDTSPTDGTIHSYVVSATGTGGTSTNSAAAVAVPKPAPPSSLPPSLYITSVITTNPSQDITLTWNAVAGAAGYAIYRATSSGGPFTLIQSVGTTSYINWGMATNTTYYYRVVALNAGGISAYATNLINPKQSAPVSLVAVATNAQITLAWSAATNATSYTLKRGTSTGNETVNVVSGYAGTSYTNTGLLNGTTYYYIVTATGANGASGNSPEASATPVVAGNGVWISPASGNWNTAANWYGNSFASGSGHTADFSTIALVSNLTVTLDSAHTISDLVFGDTAAAYNWTVAGTNILTLSTGPSVNVANQSATLSTPVAGTNGLTKIGAGTLVLGGATNTITGDITNSSGSLVLDFSIAGSPAANLLPATNALYSGGATLRVIGSPTTTSTQTFNGLSISVGTSVISAAPASGTSNPVVALGALTAQLGSTVRIIGPATVGSSGNVAATANITTTTAGDGGAAAPFGLLLGSFPAANWTPPYVTVGLYDWASTDTTSGGAGASPYTIIGGSQVSGFYSNNVSYMVQFWNGNFDLTANATTSTGNPQAATVRFNTPSATTLTERGNFLVSGFLITPNMGANNASVVVGSGGGPLQVIRQTSPNGNQEGVIWQNNTLGYFTMNPAIADGRDGTLDPNWIIKAGQGTAVFASTASTYTGQTYINEGHLLITGNGAIGDPASAKTLNLNGGGTLVGNATFALDNGVGLNPRPFLLGDDGGGLAATAGNTMMADGFVSGAGALTIGIPASAANGNTAGLLPGSGAGTANTTPVYGTGTVVLNYAPGNAFTGGVTILGGATLNINSEWAVGGAVYGGITFNNGTLQYATTLINSTDISQDSTGAAKPVTFAGSATIDVNGNNITLANPIGNGGSGGLTVKSPAVSGNLNLQGANNYFGNTTVTNARLTVSNPAGSATGSGDVFVQNGGILSGNGALAGSVVVASGGAFAPGSTADTLVVGNNLTLNTGSTTTMQIQRSPVANSSVNAGATVTFGGTLMVTNMGGTLTNGDSFQLFSAANYFGTFDSYVLPALATNLLWNTNALVVSGVISVASRTVPIVTSVQFDGDNLVVSGSGGLNAWPYYLVGSTNLTLPLANWTRLATNVFDSSGGFGFTNVVSVDTPQYFYRLIMP
ncbi:MAG: polysaccharide lyase family protein [Verrucomicrobia bacterium]|nr:polysaccharide lyase family protein [Verrucomicrobiota bacterium]